MKTGSAGGYLEVPQAEQKATSTDKPIKKERSNRKKGRGS